MTKDPIFAEAERLYMLENPGGCLAAEDETVKRYWKQQAMCPQEAAVAANSLLGGVLGSFFGWL